MTLEFFICAKGAGPVQFFSLAHVTWKSQRELLHSDAPSQLPELPLWEIPLLLSSSLKRQGQTANHKQNSFMHEHSTA